MQKVKFDSAGWSLIVYVPTNDRNQTDCSFAVLSTRRKFRRDQDQVQVQVQVKICGRKEQRSKRSKLLPTYQFAPLGNNFQLEGPDQLFLMYYTDMYICIITIQQRFKFSKSSTSSRECLALEICLKNCNIPSVLSTLKYNTGETNNKCITSQSSLTSVSKSEFKTKATNYRKRFGLSLWSAQEGSKIWHLRLQAAMLSIVSYTRDTPSFSWAKG